MDKSHLLEKAIGLAVQAHCGQKDKSGMPYILHPLRVMQRCDTVDEKIVAILHDTIEDTDITVEKLLDEGFPSYIVEAIDAVSRKEGESYEDFVRRSSMNELGKRVKINDLLDNLDGSRLSSFSEKEVERFNKYLGALSFLRG